MAKKARIGHGYGSEWHLLRYLGRHRTLLGDKVRRATGASAIQWMDFHFKDDPPWWDGERADLDFLDLFDDRDRVRSAWLDYWPHTGEMQNWDAVGILDFPKERRVLLVEAKAHVSELRSDCRAKLVGGRKRITEVLESVKEHLGVRPDADWLRGYYQYCNRLAVLHFLNANGVPAHLLFVYFVGDHFVGRQCPQSVEGWGQALGRMERHIGLPSRHELSDRVHKLFLDVRQQE